MKTSLVWTLILFTLSLFILLPHTAAINPTKLGLPEGAVARLGMGKINDIKYAPDGKHLAVASSIGVWIYDAQTGEVINLITSTDRIVGGAPEPQVSPINSISFSPDGQLLAIGTQGNNIRIWDVKLGRYRHTYRVSGLQSLSFSPDGNILASGGTAILLWDPETGKRIPHQHFSIALTAFSSINSVVFSPDGQTLASADDDETVHLWNAKTGGEPIHTLTAHTDKVLSVAFSPDGQTLASASDDETVRLWNVKTGEPIYTFSDYPAQQRVAFSPDGNILAIGSYGSIHLWDVETAKRLHTLSGYSGVITGVSFSPDGQTLAGGSDVGVLGLWDVTGEPRPIITEHISSVQEISFSPDGQTLAIQDQINNVHLWNARTEALHHTPFISKSMSFSPDGQVLASQSHNSIDLWDLQTEALLDTITTDKISRGISFSPDSQMIAAIDANGVVLLWDVKTKTLLHTSIAARTISISFSPDSQMIAGTSRTDVHLWDTKTGDILQEFTGERKIDSISFSPDSQTLAIASWLDVHLWDTETGDLLHTLTGHRGVLWEVAFSPDGKTLAVAELGAVSLWDVKTGEILRTLTERGAYSVAFSPDGKTLACDRGNTVHLWDTETGELLQELSGHTDSISSVAFSPDGRTLASGSTDGTVLLWELAPSPSETDSPTETHDISDTVNIAEYTTTVSLPEGAKTRIGKGTILDMRYTSDGKYLKVSSSIGSWLYDAETHQELGIRPISKPILGVIPGDIYSSPGDIYFSGAISPDGTTWARGGSRKDVLLSDLETDTILHTLAHPTWGGYALSFSPNGKMLLTTNRHTSVYLWDVETGKRLHTFMQPYTHSGFARGYCFSPDSATLALGDHHNVRLWDIETGELLHTWDNKATPSCIGFSPDGKTIASGRSEQSPNDHIRLWDVETGTHLRSLTAPSTKISATLGRNAGGFTSIAFSQNNKMLASGSSDGQTRLWDVGTGRFIGTMRPDPVYTDAVSLTDTVWSVAFSPDGDTLAISYLGGTLRLWDVATRRNFRTIGYTSFIFSIAFSPDGKTLATGSGGYSVGACSLWDVETGTLRHAFTADRSSIHSVAFSPDGNTLATGGLGSTLRLWNVETGALVRAIPAGDLYRGSDVIYSDVIYGLSFSPDGKRLAIARDVTVDVLEVGTGTYSHIVGSYHSEGSIAFSPDSKTLATFSAFNSANPISSDHIRLWDVETPTHQCSIFLYTPVSDHDFYFGRVFSLTFTPDSKTLAVGYSGGTHLWDVETCEKHRSIYDSGAILSSDGKTMATLSGNFDGRVIDVHLLDVNTQALVNTIEDVPAQPIRKAALPTQPLLSSLLFSPDSKTLASLTGDGTVLLWEITPTSPHPGVNAADVNGDGEVNIQDLVAVAAALGQTGETAADVNGDGEVNIQDLVAVAAALGQDAAAPAAIRQQATEHLTAADVQQWITQAQHAKLTDPKSQHGIRFLQYLLAALIPKETALFANYPNPFNPETWIPYQLANSAEVTLTIHAVDGKLVRELDLGHQPVGIYESKSRAAYWDGKNEIGESVASGVYFYTLTAGDFTATRKMLILK